MLHLNENIGVLELGVIEADLMNDTELIGRMDPYLVARVDGVEYKTVVRDSAGLHPVWNSRFHIPIKTIQT